MTVDEPRPSRARERALLWPVARLSLNALLTAAGVAVVVWVAIQLRLIVLPLLIALLLATLLVPLADSLRRLRLPSAVATLVSMIAGIAVVGLLLAIVVPAVVEQIGDVGRSAADGLDTALAWLTQGPLDLERAQIDRAVDNALGSLRDNSDVITGGVVRGAIVVGELIAGLLLAIVLVFFFVHDGRRIWRWVVSLFAPRHRADAEAIGERIWGVVSSYVRGVAVIALVDALLIGLALVLIGVPLVVPLMALTFLGAFVPLVGAVLAGAVAALVALVAIGPLAAILVVVAVTVIQQLEGDLLYPLVVGQAIALHPVAILLALTAGTVLAGLAGALLVVPVVAAVWAAIDHLRTRRGAAAPAAPAAAGVDAAAGAEG